MEWRLQISLLEHPSGVINVTAVRGWWVTGCDAMLSIYSACIPRVLHLYCPVLQHRSSADVMRVA